MQKIIVSGAMGRMGQMILEACSKEKNIEVIGATEAPQTSFIGQTTGILGADVQISANLTDIVKEEAVIIDFTLPIATLDNVKKAVEANAKMVIGSTGFTDQEKNAILDASKNIPIVMSPNMSVGVNILFKLTELASQAMGEDFDIEIIEAHHKLKKDAPSGTALGLLEAISRGTSTNKNESVKHGRNGIIGERPKGEVGIHAVRGGDIVGDHTVLYAGDGERVELKHVAHSRSTFANGAVKAALFLKDKTNGFYTMFDVLGL
jgi:4-hydroxy-tetrahydrodipicolinate reductase